MYATRSKKHLTSTSESTSGATSESTSGATSESTSGATSESAGWVDGSGSSSTASVIKPSNFVTLNVDNVRRDNTPQIVTNSVITRINSDFLISMAHGSLLPTSFCGTSKENPATWFRHVEEYCTFQNITQAARVSLVALLFRESARFFF